MIKITLLVFLALLSGANAEHRRLQDIAPTCEWFPCHAKGGEDYEYKKIGLLLDDFSKEERASQCEIMVRTLHPTANGATVKVNHTDSDKEEGEHHYSCYAEFNQTRRSSSCIDEMGNLITDTWENCQFSEPELIVVEPENTTLIAPDLDGRDPPVFDATPEEPQSVSVTTCEWFPCGGEGGDDHDYERLVLLLDDYTKEERASQCEILVRTMRPTANGASVEVSQDDGDDKEHHFSCYAEFNQTHRAECTPGGTAIEDTYENCQFALEIMTAEPEEVTLFAVPPVFDAPEVFTAPETEQATFFVDPPVSDAPEEPQSASEPTEEKEEEATPTGEITPTTEAQEQSVASQSFGTPAILGIGGGLLSLLAGGLYWAFKTGRLCRKPAGAPGLSRAGTLDSVEEELGDVFCDVELGNGGNDSVGVSGVDVELGNVAHSPMPMRHSLTASPVDMELGNVAHATAPQKPQRGPFKLWESYDIEHQGSEEGLKKVLHAHVPTH